MKNRTLSSLEYLYMRKSCQQCVLDELGEQILKLFNLSGVIAWLTERKPRNVIVVYNPSYCIVE